jgi:hypothetical protein
MAKIFKKQFATKYTKNDFKSIVNKLLLDMPMLKSLCDKVDWADDSLIFISKFGDGYIAISDYSVIVEIHLNFIGSMVIGQIEQVLDKQFDDLLK